MSNKNHRWTVVAADVANRKVVAGAIRLICKAGVEDLGGIQRQTFGCRDDLRCSRAVRIS